MAAAIVPRRRSILMLSWSGAWILLTPAPYAGRSVANRMVLPLRAVRRTNDCLPAVDPHAGLHDRSVPCAHVGCEGEIRSADEDVGGVAMAVRYAAMQWRNIVPEASNCVREIACPIYRKRQASHR